MLMTSLYSSRERNCKDFIFSDMYAVYMIIIIVSIQIIIISDLPRLIRGMNPSTYRMQPSSPVGTDSDNHVVDNSVY